MMADLTMERGTNSVSNNHFFFETNDTQGARRTIFFGVRV